MNTIARADVDNISIKYIPGTKDMYAIDKNGKAYSFKYNNEEARQLKYGRQGQNGYAAIAVCTGRDIKSLYIHRLLAELFVENDSPETKTRVMIVNGNKEDLRVDNIRWCTASESCLTESRVRKIRESIKEYRRNGWVQKHVAEIDEDGNIIHVYAYAKEAARSIDPTRENSIATGISYVCNKKQGHKSVQHRLFKWIDEKEYHANISLHVVCETELQKKRRESGNPDEEITQVIYRKYNPKTGKYAVDTDEFGKDEKIETILF